MLKVVLMLIVSSVILFGATESFYKKKYDFYIKKVEKSFKQWQHLELLTSLSENFLSQTSSLNNQIYGYLDETEESRDARQEERDAEKALKIEQQEAKEEHNTYIEYIDKITELSFTAEEELGKLPEWFKVPEEKKGNF
ncbi:hypothetical protein [Sulfurimonas sp.]|uniref:hypothetical protein n=1 Tax=Sulfurimonas sp. TaxID=2022749 RepID=UPI0025D8851A|nr:hypothetical protein [Sulfurimonas sp.]